MTTTLITTPNGSQQRVRQNSWYVLHIMTNQARDAYQSLDQEEVLRDDGSRRYMVRLPVLLSIASSEEKEILMDVSDVCRCYEVPYSRYLRIQLFLDGKEVPAPGQHAPINSGAYISKPNSWYILHVKEDLVNYYEKLNPTAYRFDDGTTRYRVRLPILIGTTGAAQGSPLEIGEVCRKLNVPIHLYEHLQMVVDGEEVEHPDNKRSQRSYNLKGCRYYLGDPGRLPGDKPGIYEDFVGNHTFSETVVYQGHLIINIHTGADGTYCLMNKKNPDKHSSRKPGAANAIASLHTDLAVLSFIPLVFLESLGITAEEAAEQGLLLDTHPQPGSPGDDGFMVTIHDKGGIIQSVDFLNYSLLIGAKNRSADARE